MLRHLAIGALGALALAACSSSASSRSGARMSLGDGSNPDARAQLERLKQLEGTWTTAAGSSRPGQTIRYTNVAGGTAVLEEMFPGTDHSMVTLYHLDGPELMLTHYCSAGNQPSMRAARSDADGTIRFTYCCGTNMDPSKDGHMHTASVRVIDRENAVSEWAYWNGEKPDHGAVFVLKRAVR